LKKDLLVVCSKSTKKYFKSYERHYVVTSPPKKDILELKDSEDVVIAIGGGATIDTAKIISKNPIISYPTTAAGSAKTSHSVYWDGINKLSMKKHIPKEAHVVEEYVKDLPSSIVECTTYDALSHCLDSMWSKRSSKESMYYVDQALEILKGDFSNSDLIHAGNLAGSAIELCPTTILHSLSYPITAYYGISHGVALGYLLPKISQFMNTDISDYIKYPPVRLPQVDPILIAKESLKYSKIYDTIKNVDMDILVDILSS